MRGIEHFISLFVSLEAKRRKIMAQFSIFGDILDHMIYIVNNKPLPYYFHSLFIFSFLT